MLKKIIAWLKTWLMESTWPDMTKDPLMAMTKYRGPKKQRYYKYNIDIGRRVNYHMPIKETANA